MLLQVHDELVCEVPRKEVDAFTAAGGGVMTNALPLSVPVQVDVGSGRTGWRRIERAQAPRTRLPADALLSQSLRDDGAADRRMLNRLTEPGAGPPPVGS